MVHTSKRALEANAFESHWQNHLGQGIGFGFGREFFFGQRPFALPVQHIGFLPLATFDPLESLASLKHNLVVSRRVTTNQNPLFPGELVTRSNQSYRFENPGAAVFLFVSGVTTGFGQAFESDPSRPDPRRRRPCRRETRTRTRCPRASTRWTTSLVLDAGVFFLLCLLPLCSFRGFGNRRVLLKQRRGGNLGGRKLAAFQGTMHWCFGV